MVMVGCVFYTGPAAKAISQRIHGKTSSEFFFFLQYNGLVSFYMYLTSDFYLMCPTIALNKSNPFIKSK